MLVSSSVNNNKWIWVKVPKTGTRAYSLLFHAQGEDEFYKDGFRFFHLHQSFHNLYIHHGKRYSGFTVVRHPKTRFISALKHLADLHVSHPQHTTNLPFASIDSLVYFLFNNFDKNCIPKDNRTIEEIFGLHFSSYYNSFFKTQTFWAYHPKINIFRYEELDTFNNWIEMQLGFNTKTLQRVGEIKTNHLEHLDFSSPKFDAIVQHLFYDDYRSFNYQEEI